MPVGGGKRSARDEARLLLATSRERFAAAAVDLHLPERSRLSEWQRHTAATLLTCLVRSVEDSLRAALARHFAGHEALHAALTSTHVAIALPLLERAQVLRDPELGTVLVRRVEEHFFWTENGPHEGDDLLSGLVRDGDETVAGEAMALLVARSRRFDRYQEPLLGHTDLPADLQHRLVWMAAAALRQYVTQQHELGGGAADAAIAEVAETMIASYDEGRTMEAAAMRLARRLAQLGRLEGTDLVAALEDGLLALFVAGIGVRCGLDYEASWEVLSDVEGTGPALLLRAGGISRQQAADILFLLNERGRLFSGQDGDAAARQFGLFDKASERDAADVLRLWRVDPGYRAAVARLSIRGGRIGTL